jgi:hypothetical protein
MAHYDFMEDSKAFIEEKSEEKDFIFIAVIERPSEKVEFYKFNKPEAIFSVITANSNTMKVERIFKINRVGQTQEFTIAFKDGKLQVVEKGE